MKKHLLPLLLCCGLLAGCTAAGADVRQIGEIPGDAAIPPLVSADQAETGYAAFAAELLRQTRKEGENTLVSPLSVALALGMTANGAAGDTLAEFQTLFGMDLDTLNAYCAKALHDYSGLGGSTRSTLVNSLWCDPDLTLEDEFIARCQQNYGAELYQADLQQPATVRAVNNWVSKATEGLIPKTVEEFSEDTVLALVNAIYLQNKFERPFETPHSAWTMDFTAADGVVSHPRGMHNGTRDEWYLSHAGGSGVLLPYDDGRLGFLLMLPKDGVQLSDYLSGWDGTTVKTLLDGREERRVSLTVPKYELEWSGSLAEVLPEMGLSGAFDVAAADFSAMGSSDNGPLFIGDVIHKTVLKVNEKGTEAAAVTVVEAPAGAAMPTDLVVLRFDRPFICGIVDTESGAPLFLGTVETLG